MSEKKNCLGCDYFFPIEDLTLQFVDQYGEVNLCNECINRLERGDEE